MNFEVVFTEICKREYVGTRESAEKVAKLLGAESIREVDGRYVFVTPLQAEIYEFDDDGSILDKCDPMPYLRNTTANFKCLKRQLVIELLDDLISGRVDFDDVCDAAANYDQI